MELQKQKKNWEELTNAYSQDRIKHSFANKEFGVTAIQILFSEKSHRENLKEIELLDCGKLDEGIRGEYVP